jgi:hypothetical protein
MAASRHELREQLVAALEASPELDPENRADLADVFLDRLEGEYRLIPKSAPAPQPVPPAARGWDGSPPWVGRGRQGSHIPMVVMLFVGFMLLVAIGHVHLAGIFPILLLFLVFRAVFYGGRGRRGWSGPNWR